MTAQPAVAELVAAHRHDIESPLVDVLGREVQGEHLQEVHRVLRDLGTEVRALDDEARRELGHADEPVQEEPNRLRRIDTAELGGHHLLPRLAVALHAHRQQLKRLAFVAAVVVIAHAAGTYSRRTR